MGLFGFKKKKEESLDLPPPPMPLAESEFPPLPEQSFEAPEAPEIEDVHAPEPVEETPTPRGRPAQADHEGPLFVSVQDYQAVLNGVTSIKSKLSDIEESFRKLGEIKAGQDRKSVV